MSDQYLNNLTISGFSLLQALIVCVFSGFFFTVGLRGLIKAWPTKKLSEKYDYTVSWRDAYNNFKPILSQTDLPKEQKKEMTAFFKEIVFLSETKTTRSCG